MFDLSEPEVLLGHMPEASVRQGLGDKVGEPYVSLVVLSHNRLPYTMSCIASVMACTRVQHELIVVDNGSAPEVVETLAELKRRGCIDKLVLLPENMGTAGGYNRGFAAASEHSTHVVKLDNDMNVETVGWMQNIVGFLAAYPKAGMACGYMVNHRRLRELKTDTIEGYVVKSWSRGWVAGGPGMTIPKRVWDELGPFSEHYPGEIKLQPDDVEYWCRIKAAKLGAYYVVASEVRGRYDLDGEWPKYKRWKRKQYAKLRGPEGFFKKVRAARGKWPKDPQ